MSGQVYRAAGFFMLRTPTLPVDEFLSITSGSREDSRRRLRDLAGTPRVRQALHVASPSLTAGLAHLDAESKKSERAYSSLLRYVTRMSTRPTPYGLFSGIGVGNFGSTTSLRLAADPVGRTRTRADVGWLLNLVKHVESGDLDQLRVVVNPMLYRVGDRAVLPFADVHGQADNRLVGFRLTVPAEIALRSAGIPGTTVAEIVQRIVGEVPGATPEKALGLVTQLRDLHVLVSDLRPAMSVALPEQDLLKRLDGLDSTVDIQEGLRTTRVLATAVDDHDGTAPVSVVDELSQHQRAMTPGHTKETFQLDTALALTASELNELVGADAADAAEVLLRINGAPQRPEHIVEYHNAFLERYGVESEIPLLDLLSPERGLDAPSTYTMPPRAFPLPAVPQEHSSRQRDAVMTGLLAGALHRGQHEIELTDDLVERLTAWRPGSSGPRVRPSLDLYAQVAARSREALDAGDYRLVVAPGSMTDGGRTFGRFFDLVDEPALADLQDFARAEESLCPDVVFAELSFVSPHGRGGNVTAHPPIRRYEICVNTSPSVPQEQRIALTDIMVGATAERFYLRSRRLGKEIVVTQGHMLTPVSAPNVCRLLLELSMDGLAPLAGFDWGSAAASPFLPRVRRGRTVLHPAQWSISAGTDIEQWRREWRVPRYVYLVFMDNRLLLDLDHPMCVEELRGELKRTANRVVLHELLPDFDDAWLSDVDGQRYFGEVVVPMLAQDPALTRRSAVPSIVDSPTGERRRQVGDEWLYLKLYSAGTQHDDVISGPLRTLVAELGEAIDRWFYVRYCDPYPHLRLRFRVPDETARPAVMAHCVAWARQLVSAGLAADIALTGYDLELERYGGPEAFDAVEATFEANSAVCAGLVGYLRANPDLSPEAVSVLALHSLYRDWGMDPLTSIHSPGEGVSDRARKRFKGLRPLLCDLLEPWDAHPDPLARKHLDALSTILSGQRDALAAAGARVREVAAAGERRILASLGHMQVNRLLGIDQERERECHELWSLALRMIKGRPA
ncbi:lantibiotic dehydratase [Allokutzneria oryzae]|uniref:Lantibiotic dehydratase n=1 Tax=Allokutzneria oryzae TaxID=1378989 RepID=A0ABV5ZSK8_9PSEU